MNERKIEIIEKVLGVHNWHLMEDKNKLPNFILILNGMGKVIMDYDKRNKVLFYRFNHIKQLKLLINFNWGEATNLMKTMARDHLKLDIMVATGRPYGEMRLTEQYFEYMNNE